MKEYVMYVYGFTVTRGMLDELGHANYNKIKEHLEIARHRLCKFLGFGRKTLRKRLGLGLFMLQDAYKYHEQLKEGDVLFTLAQIAIDGRTSRILNQFLNFLPILPESFSDNFRIGRLCTLIPFKSILGTSFFGWIL